MTLRLKVVALVTLAVSSVPVFSSLLYPAAASTLFSRAEIDQNKLVAVASPYASGKAHQLLIIEQIANSRPCWSESSNGGLTVINPLLGQFDFTGICGRSLDSNGYSIRMGEQDLGWKYSLRVVKRNGDLVLVGAPNNRSLPELQIGRANGLTNGFAKLSLNPGWRMTKRVYNGQSVGHIYLTNDQPISSTIAAGPAKPTLPASRPPVVPSVPLPVPPPLSSVKPSPATQPPASTPIFVPRSGASTGVSTQPAPDQVGGSPVVGRPVVNRPLVGRPINVPLPLTVTQPVGGSSGAIAQPPVSSPIKPPVSSPISSPAVKPAPVVSAPKPMVNAPKPMVNAGDFVVPTIANP